jgi:hypothetical protein
MTETWSVRGYGVKFGNDDGTNTTPDKIRTLLTLAPNFKNEIQTFFEDIDVDYNKATIDDFADFDQDYGTGIPYIIAHVMNERYGSYDLMCANIDEDNYLYLFMPACMPWELTEYQKTLSQEQLKTMIKENYNILYDDDPIVDYVWINQFG